MDRYILYGLVGLILAYIFLPDFFPTKEYKPDQALVNRIDSLEQWNKYLEESLIQLDSAQFELIQQLDQLDIKISSAKGKTTIIKQVYKEKGDNARKFTPSQVDSFFRDRYNF